MFRLYISLFLAIFIISGCRLTPEASLNQGNDHFYQDEVFEPKEALKEPVSLGPVVAPSKEPQPLIEPILEVIKPIIEKATSTIENIMATSSATIHKPGILIYDVPFASQAPFANWNSPFDEACEEASMIMVDRYYRGLSLTNSLMNSEIIKIIDWQTNRGYRVDLTAKETKDVLLDFFGLTSRLLVDPTLDDIKKELDQGNLILVPAAGRELGNPYFTPPGPIYHMLVIVGYDDNTQEFITNDPGTKRGEKFRYHYQTLLNANHNWNHDLALGGMTDEEMAQGSSIMIAVDK